MTRLNSDIRGAQQTVTTLLAQTASTVLTVVFILAAMFYLSWQITLAALLMIPMFLGPAKALGGRLQRLTRQMRQYDAELGSMMNERFKVGGAIFTKPYGRPEEETQTFSGKAGKVRDVAVVSLMYARMFGIIAALLTALTTALVYGLGGGLVIHGVFQVGTLVAMVTLLMRLYGPVNQLSGVQASVMMALVSFDRVFEILDLRSLVRERPDARALPASTSAGKVAPAIEFYNVSFRYPTAKEVSLASLESIAVPTKERPDSALVLHDVSFTAPAGQLTALVGLSGGGKTTTTQLVSRLYDPSEGAVRIGGHDLRELTLASVYDTVGVVTQDARSTTPSEPTCSTRAPQRPRRR